MTIKRTTKRTVKETGDGSLEERSRKIKSRQDIQNKILAVVEFSGVLALAAVAPNVTELLRSFGYDPKRRQKEIIARARQKLVHKGMLVYKGGFLHITQKGEEELRKSEIKNWKLEKPKRWDGRWRMLIFDIPEKNKTIRDKVRQTLFHIGFVRVQDSVWIYPYDCEELVTLLKADFKIGKDLLYLIVDSMENDTTFRRLFSLPKRY